MKTVTWVTVSLLYISMMCGCTIVEETELVSYQYNDQERDVLVSIYYPQEQIEALPLVVFSDGYFMSPDSYQSLLRNLVQNGYIVVAPHHHDYLAINTTGFGLFNVELPQFLSDIEQARDALSQIEEYANITNEEIIALFFNRAFSSSPHAAEVESLLSENFSYRVREFEAALEYALKRNDDSQDTLYGRIDTTRVLALCHSFGGHTVLEKVSTTSASYDQRIQAAVFMSPIHELGDATGVTIPTLWMTGTLDDTEFLNGTQRLFEQVVGPSYFLSLKKVGHVSFSSQLCSMVIGLSAIAARLQVPDGTSETNRAAAENYGEKGRAIADATIMFFNAQLEQTMSDPFADSFTQGYAFGYMVDAFEVSSD